MSSFSCGMFMLMGGGVASFAGGAIAEIDREDDDSNSDTVVYRINDEHNIKCRQCFYFCPKSVGCNKADTVMYSSLVLEA